MRKRINAAFTIEAAVLVPLILMIFGVLVHILFYYHDKNVLLGLTHETAVLGSGRDGMREYDLERQLFSKASGRLLLMKGIDPDVYLEEEQIMVVCSAKKGKMSMSVECKMSRTNPEDSIRSVRKIKKIQEGIGKED